MEIKNINNGIKSHIMDLKTSTLGMTRKEEIKTGFKNINDYSVYLNEKYSYMNTGIKAMYDVPVTANVSSNFLKRCMDNPEKAAFLEENLAAIPNCIKRSVEYTKTMAGSPVMTYCKISISDDGNITMISGCTNDPDGKIAKENSLKKLEQKKALEEKNVKRRIARKEEKEKKTEEHVKRIEESKEFTVKLTGSSVKNISQIMLERMINKTTEFITLGINMKV